jgi:hypothetical protein
MDDGADEVIRSTEVDHVIKFQIKDILTLQNELYQLDKVPPIDKVRTLSAHPKFITLIKFDFGR